MAISFDHTFYRETYADLSNMDDDQLYFHFLQYGIAEGRAGSKYAFRENFISQIHKKSSVLEIGPFSSPVITGPNVRYFDVLSTKDLRARAISLGNSGKTVPEINYVSPNGDLDIVREKFDFVISSHCIEHQPNLVKHLSQVSRILNKDGLYFLLIPDKRFCFDHYIAESTLALVLDAHVENRVTHRVASVIEHRALTTHNDTLQHWQGIHTDGDNRGRAERAKAALAEISHAQGSYIDVHAWQFTPECFGTIIDDLGKIGLIDLEIDQLHATPFGRNEFTAVLRKINN